MAMKIKLLTNENWDKVLEEVSVATEKLGVEIEPTPHFMGHMPREEYLDGKYGINRQYLSVILPREFVILHADFPIEGASGWFSVINGNPVIQIYQRGTQFSRDPNFKYWESEIIIHELCHYYYWKNGLEDRTHYFDYEKNDLMSAVEDIFVGLYAKKVGLMERAVRLMRKIINKKPEERISRITDWALAIQQYEGWYEGSLTHRTNNPGALRFSKYESDNRNGFSVFKDYETGFKALEYQLTIATDGRSNVYNPEMTLLEFFEKYAPKSDNNNPKKYAEFVAKRLGVEMSVKIKELL